MLRGSKTTPAIGAGVIVYEPLGSPVNVYIPVALVTTDLAIWIEPNAVVPVRFIVRLATPICAFTGPTVRGVTPLLGHTAKAIDPMPRSITITTKKDKILHLLFILTLLF